jgi:ribonuclease P protein component
MNQDEKDVSTKQCSSQTDTWISQTHEHNRRTRRPQTTPRQGAQTPDRTGSTQTSTTLIAERRVGQYVFPKAVRLLARREFLFLQAKGKRRHCPHFVVVTAPAKGEQSRLGITATRRFGNAVVRNRMKRILREFFRTHREQISPAQDILIIPRAGAEKLEFAQVAKELGRALAIAANAN